MAPCYNCAANPGTQVTRTISGKRVRICDTCAERRDEAHSPRG